MAHISSGVSGSLFFWRLAHFFLDNRKQTPFLLKY